MVGRLASPPASPGLGALVGAMAAHNLKKVGVH
jgi:hypothetical protein